jgi:hypothetical protein
VGDWSFNPRSTPSRLSFVHSPPIPPPPHSSLPPIPPSTTLNRPSMSPSPLLRDVGSNSNATTHLRSEDDPHPPLPFPKGCGRLILARRRNLGRWKHEGGPRVWEAHAVCPNNEPRFSLWFIFFFPRSSNPADSSVPNANAANNDADKDKSRQRRKHQVDTEVECSPTQPQQLEPQGCS